jgi:threonyl-tRNA synthetase
VDIDDSADKLGAKIRNARLARYPYILVTGPKEAETRTLGVRSRDAGELGAISVADFTAKLKVESAPPRAGSSAASAAAGAVTA